VVINTQMLHIFFHSFHPIFDPQFPINMRHLNLLLAVTAVVFLMNMHTEEGFRVMEEEGTNKDLLVESLQKGPVPPSAPSGCTYIPGRGGAPCTSQRGFAGHAMAPPQAYSNAGVASDTK
jgi:hypothetical protein